MDTFLQDIRYAVRGLLRDRSFTLVAVLTLALGIGANASIFSFLDALLLHPFDFPRMERLVYLTERIPGSERFNMSPASLADVQEGAPSLEHVSAYEWWGVNLTGAGEPERLIAYQAAPSLFTTLGTPAALGRTFLPEGEEEGRQQVTVLSYGLWQQHFGGDPGVLGRTLMLNGLPHTVVGVMPSDFRFPKAAQLWAPLVLSAEDRTKRREHRFEAVARLKEGATLEQARAELTVLEKRLAVEDPAHRLSVVSLQDYGDPPQHQMMWVLMAAVGLVLLVACANVAGMLLARAARRARELAIRTSLGASRARIARQLLTESLMLALMGGALGLLFALWGVDLIRAGMPADVARFIAGWSRVGLNPRVLAFTCAAMGVATLVFGLVPALRGSQTQPAEVLRREVRGSARQRLRQILVAAQVAFALVVTVSAALNASSFATMLGAPLGFSRERLLTLRMGPGETKYPDAASVARFYDEALGRLRALPGVSAVAVAGYVPMGNDWVTRALEVEGREQPPGQETRVLMQVVSEDFFSTLGVALREGTLFSPLQGPDTQPVAIVSESLARRHFGSESPVGRRLAVGMKDGKPLWRTVVGVVADARHGSFLSERDGWSVVYLPLRQADWRDMSILLRTSGDPMALAPQVRGALLALDADQPVSELKSHERVLHDTMMAPRYAMVLLLVFAGIALLLSAVGVYGVMAYDVSLRTHEIGVRMALGAQGQDVVRLVVGQGLRPTLAGVGVGLLGAWACTRAMSGMLYGVSPFDPGLFILTALLLIVVALVAALVPVRHATRVDPLTALRAE